MAKESPYLTNDNRLSDVIAAIQAMGTYRFYKLDFAGWSDRITGDAGHAGYWRHIFEQHPEFFRLDSKREKASLVWRRQHPRRFHVDLGRELSREEYAQLREEEMTRLSRTPLDSQEIAALINIAIGLYGHCMERRKDQRWLTTTLLSLGGVVLGAAVSAWAN